MQTANVKGKDETYARRLHCLPLLPPAAAPPRRDRRRVTWRLPPLPLERVEIRTKRNRRKTGHAIGKTGNWAWASGQAASRPWASAFLAKGGQPDRGEGPRGPSEFWFR